MPLRFVSFSVIKRSAQVRLEVSENKEAEFSPPRVTDALGVQWTLTPAKKPWTERKPGRGPRGLQPHSLGGCVRRGVRETAGWTH